MKSLLSLCLIAGSAWIATHTLDHPSDKTIPAGTSFFTCNIDGKTFRVVAANDSSLTTTFTYTDSKHLSPAALFINVEQGQKNSKSCFYIQPVNDNEPATSLTTCNNLYNNFYITYKAPDNTFYHSTDAPGNLEVTAIDTIQKVITGKLNCILYSSEQKDWLIVTKGRFCFKF